MKKVVIACDKFKGCLSSAEVARCGEVAVRRVTPGCEIVSLPVGDGGEGTASALSDAVRGQVVQCDAVDPLRRPIKAGYCLSADGLTAVIDMSASAGLSLLAESERDPEQTTTFGVGLMIADAVRRGARHIIVGLGGSATNDAGLGMLTALGFLFKDASGNTLVPTGASLSHVDVIDVSGVSPIYSDVRFEGACDVTNPFYGHSGAACVFASQKGADQAAVERLDRGLRHFAETVKQTFGCDMQQVVGSGAAGGLGGTLAAFLNAPLRRGIDLVLDMMRFDDLLADADLVITGEGHIDAQTLMGKAPAGILDRSRRHGVKVMAIAGCVDDREALLSAGFDDIVDINEGATDRGDALDPEVARRRIVDALVRRLS